MKHRAKREFAENFTYLLQLIACVLNDTMPPKPTRETDWASVFSMAELHSVAGLVSYAVDRLCDEDKPTSDIVEKFRNHQTECIIRESNIDYETSQLISELASQNVQILPLKGIVLKNDYPMPHLRTMTDVDLLYMEQDKNKVKEIFENRGYSLKSEIDNQLDFTKDPFHHYELHTWLFSPTDALTNEYFSHIWERVTFPQNAFIGELGVQDRYIYLIEHLAKHLEHGGAGLRMIMDVYVFNKNHNSELDSEYLNNEFGKLELLDFSRIIKDIAYNWFSGDTPVTDTISADFILCSCTFGTSRDAILQNAIRTQHLSKNNSCVPKRLLRKVFPPAERLAMHFSILKRHKILYPFLVPVYWFLRIFRHRNINIANMKYYFKATDSEDVQRLCRVMDELGLSSHIGR